MTNDVTSNPLHVLNSSEGEIEGSPRSTPSRRKRDVDSESWATEVFQIRGPSKEKGSAVDVKNERLGVVTLFLLFFLGIAAGLLNGGILAANAALCKIQAQLIVVGGHESYSFGLLYFVLIMSGLVFFASCACKYGSRAAAGSGLPEFKYLLGSEMGAAGFEKLISLRILVFKVIGLVLSVGGGLSVGSEGPLVHTAACVAYMLIKNVPDFTEILESPSVLKQIFAASAAVGVSSAFNSPIGGCLFSIEVTSTFYLVANYWRSFIAAAAGAVACNLLYATQQGGSNSDPLLVLHMPSSDKPQYAKWELAIFLVMGFGGGWLAHGYLLLHKHISAFMKPYNRDRPLVIVLIAAVLTAFVVYITGQYSETSVGVVSLVSDTFNKGKIVEMTKISFMKGKPMEALLLAFGCRVLLTLIGTNILVPAGIFMPVTLIGGLLGRFIGHMVVECGYENANISAYALVGACAFAAGITHTISVAVIMVEMTGNLRMLLPCLVVSVIAAGITKAHGVSVYDIGMRNKGLETFQLLLLERDGTHRVAGSIMDEAVVMIPQHCSILSILKDLQVASQQQTYPLIDSANTKQPRLLGSMQRADIYKFLAIIFEQHALSKVLRSMLPADADENDRTEALREMSLRMRRERSRYKKIITDAISFTPRRSDQDKSDDVNNNAATTAATKNPLHKDVHRSKVGPKRAKNGYALAPVEGSELDVDSRPATDDDDVVLIMETPKRSYRDHKDTPGSVSESAKSNRSVDDSLLWNTMSQAAHTFVSMVGLSSSPFSSSSSPAKTSGSDPPFSFDPNDPAVSAVFRMSVDIVKDEDLTVNLFPFSISEKAPMEQLYILLEMAKMANIFIVSDDDGSLKGMISREQLLESLKRKS